MSPPTLSKVSNRLIQSRHLHPNYRSIPSSQSKFPLNPVILMVILRIPHPVHTFIPESRIILLQNPESRPSNKANPVSWKTHWGFSFSTRQWEVERFSYDPKMNAREFSRNQWILLVDVIPQHNWTIEQCLLHIRVFWRENEKSVFWSYHPLAGKANNEHLPKPFFKVIRKSF